MTLKIEKEKGRPQSGITALIDGDIIAYQCGFSCQHNIHTVTLIGEDEPRASFTKKKEMKAWIESENLEESEYTVDTRLEVEPMANALFTVNQFINSVLEATNAQYHKVFLTGKGNFRDEIAVTQKYKGNRDSMEKPVHYQAIRDHLVKRWGATVVNGTEADDMLAIEQTTPFSYILQDIQDGRDKDIKHCSYTVICSIDKDLKQIPGWHYNWNKDESPVWISEEEARFNFWKQMLTGDSVDNIAGVPGIGPKRAELALKNCTTEKEMYDVVFSKYREMMFPNGIKHPQLLEEVKARVKENAQLLFMIRELDTEGNPIHWREPE